jgi:hypothetical protein
MRRGDLRDKPHQLERSRTSGSGGPAQHAGADSADESASLPEATVECFADLVEDLGSATRCRKRRRCRADPGQDGPPKAQPESWATVPL